MSMIFSQTIQNLNKALSKTAERQSLLLTNVANANVPGYKRKDMDFNIQMDHASSGSKLKIKGHLHDLGSHSATGTTIRVDGNNVDLEHEVFSLAETESRYNILTELADRHFKDIKNVIHEGR